MASTLPSCPCCDEDALRLESCTLENGDFHYRVRCDCCDIEYRHEDFYGCKPVMAFFEKGGRGGCEDMGGDGGFTCSHCGYAHEYAPEELKDPRAFSFCPACGFEVRR